ncbi:CD74 molecule, major histocompatibility complex, class II invariant chain a [Astyanax mexicanus]|uniref:CD74 molecule, major histocompatibility complex, class II invariant chain a n=1 Tax=Astyanax mexicanus TaxID=7994 RepID=UPI0020CACD26|nr:CD74 molecule, major histocompatibility complex, class II invariant chain a [Astyanax mexicanus]
MDDQQNSALLERAPSSDSFTPPRSNANTKALKVAGLTLLACLLLAGQALTAYFVLGQRDHITALEQGQENLKVQLMRRPSGGAKQMHVPMNSLPLMTSLSDDDVPKQKTPLTKLQSTSFQREGSGIWDGPRMPSKRMFRPMDSLPLLTDITEEKVEDPKGTESAATEVESKCQLDAEREVRPGYFRPQCDEEGNYLPTQCWHSTGYCWCVDKNGNKIPGTQIRGRPHCGDVNAESA